MSPRPGCGPHSWPSTVDRAWETCDSNRSSSCDRISLRLKPLLTVCTGSTQLSARWSLWGLSLDTALPRGLRIHSLIVQSVSQSATQLSVSRSISHSAFIRSASHDVPRLLCPSPSMPGRLGACSEPCESRITVLCHCSGLWQKPPRWGRTLLRHQTAPREVAQAASAGLLRVLGPLGWRSLHRAPLRWSTYCKNDGVRAHTCNTSTWGD